MLPAVLALIVVALAISLPLTAVLVRTGHRVGALDSAGSGGHQKVLRSVPNIGGIAIFWAIALPLGAGLLVLSVIDPDRLASWLPPIEPFLARLRGAEGGVAPVATGWALLAGMTALHVMGLVDDRRALPALLKLAVQVGVTVALVVWFDVRMLTMLGPALSILVSVLWIITITNAMNFLDNMDGLAGGVGAIASALFMAACIINAQWFIAALLALLIGALLGFLVFNVPPARIFMGDGGSLVLGFLLAILTVRTTFVHPSLGGGAYAVFMPLIVLAIPLYDFVTVTALRLRQGKSPLVGDQQHFSHRLVQRWLTRRGAVLVIWAATLVTGIGGIALDRLELWQAILVAVQTLCVLLMLALLERGGPERADG